MGVMSLDAWREMTLTMLQDPKTWPQAVLPVKRLAKGGRLVSDVDLAVVVCVENTPGSYRYDVYATNMFQMNLEEKNRVMKRVTPEEVVAEGWLVD